MGTIILDGDSVIKHHIALLIFLQTGISNQVVSHFLVYPFYKGYEVIKIKKLRILRYRVMNYDYDMRVW